MSAAVSDLHSRDGGLSGRSLGGQELGSLSLPKLSYDDQHSHAEVDVEEDKTPDERDLEVALVVVVEEGEAGALVHVQLGQLERLRAVLGVIGPLEWFRLDMIQIYIHCEPNPVPHGIIVDQLELSSCEQAE